MARTDQGSYSFCDFTLDASKERVVRGSTELRLRPKSFQVLHYLVEHHGPLVTREELLRAIWHDVAVSDESITKCIAEIRRALADESQEIIRTVTKRGFLFQAEVHLVEAVPKTAQGTRPGPRRMLPSRRTVLVAGRVAIGLVAALASLISTPWRGRLFGRKPAFEAIAVLPFESLSTNPDQQYVADGMTEALITNLGQASLLRVIARTSVNQYLKTRKPVREIARELNVDALVEGTIIQSGNHLRVTANLIQVSPERHIWSHSYERDFRDALALQNEIASAIAGEVQGKLIPRERSRLTTSRPVDPEAQLTYWKAQYLLNNTDGDLPDLQKVIKYSEQAVRIAPDFAPAYASLARAYAFWAGNSQALPREVVARAKAAAQQAIALDETLPFAHGALSAILLIYDRDWAGAEREARRAISLNPSDAEGHKWLANCFAALGRVNEAVAEMERARELDPLSATTNWNVGRILCLARRYDEALASLRQTADMQRNSLAVDIWLFKSYWMKGQPDEAIAADLRVRSLRDVPNTKSLAVLQAAYSRGGSSAYWTNVRKLVLPKFRTYPTGWYRLAEINTYLGDKEEAFRWLEKAVDERPNWITFMKVDPTLDPLRSDPRFGALLQRMGLPP
jgi:TolB-like protein/DNA-binding winged helix-turn-helix (wHTH) protein/Flp pilus assembly protein TadD